MSVQILLQQIDLLLASQAGNLAYHLIMILAIGGGFQASLFFWQQDKKLHKAHIPVGFAILVCVQLIYLFIDGMGWQILPSTGIIKPILDRSISTFSLSLVIWIWAFPMFMRPSVKYALIASGAVLLVIGGIAWVSYYLYYLNRLNSWLVETIWQSLSNLIILVGAVLFVYRNPPARTLGLCFLGLSFIGHFVQLLYWTFPQAIPGIVHLSEIIAFPLVISLPYRSISTRPGIIAPRPPGQERRRFSADPKSVHSFLSLALENDAAKASLAITQTVCQAILADLCILFSETQNKNIMKIECGYDLIREKELEGSSIEKEKLPLVSAAIDQGRCLRFPANSSTSTDAKTFSDLFALDNPGNVLVAPLLGPGQAVLGGFVLLSPYSNRLWNSDDQAYLSRIAEDITPLYLRFHQINQQTSETEKLDSNLTQAYQTINELKDAITSLTAEIEQLKIEGVENYPPSSETSHYENELRLALIEVARLQNALAASNMKILQMEKESSHQSSQVNITSETEET